MGKKNRWKNSQGDEVTDDVMEPVTAIEEIEAKPVPVEVPEVIEEHKLDFDGWYAGRASRIPAHHHKEIIRADFRGRKVPVMATMAEFDAALKKYGV